MSKKKTKPADPATPIRPPKKTELSLRVVYTERELLEIGKKLAEANRELDAAESEKKQITATLKAKCDGIAARVSQHSGEISSGYTYRMVPCEVHFDMPAPGQKTTVRLDTKEVIDTEAMTLAEMQAELPGFEGQAGEERPAATVSGSGVVLMDADGHLAADEQDRTT
jgi:hypothetical protein